MSDIERLLELLAGLELALYRDKQSDLPYYRLQKAIEDKIKDTRESLRVALYEVRQKDTSKTKQY